jgi:hypothetical protein
MEHKATNGSSPASHSPTATVLVLVRERTLEKEFSPVAPRGSSLPLADDSRGRLTVLTGPRAGQVLELDGAEVTIGRAADSGLRVDEPGASEHHARIARAPGDGFYIVDLASENGTFVGANRIGLALLRGGDVLRLGPTTQLRFDIIETCAPAPSVIDRGLH